MAEIRVENAKMYAEVRVENAKADVIQGGESIVRGVLDPDTLMHLQVDDYQREVLTMQDAPALMNAYGRGAVEDIQLGVRGPLPDIHESDHAITITDPVYIVDGLQRQTVALQMLALEGQPVPHVGALLRFNSTEEIERARFEIANWRRRNVSPNVRARNSRFDNKGVAVIYDLTLSSKFALHDRVQWTQRRKKEDLISAMTLLLVTSRLHAHIIAASGNSNEHLITAAAALFEKVGSATMIENVNTFFDVVDQAWGIRNITIRGRTPQLNQIFLEGLCRLYTDHTDFWRGNKLMVIRRDRTKLKSFNVNDPNIAALTGSGSGRPIIAELLRQKINSGRRQEQRLTPRHDRVHAEDEHDNEAQDEQLEMEDAMDS